MYAEGFTVSRILAACDMSLGTIGSGYIIAVAFGCLALGGVLHLVGLVFLRRLRA